MKLCLVQPHRICYGCGNNHSTKNTRGCELWYPNYGTGYFLCHYCYDHILRKEYRDKNNTSRIVFKNKRIFNRTKVVRIGVCNNCRAVVGIDCKRTNLHHEMYDEISPLSNTIELCPKCHGKLGNSGQFKS